MAQVLPLRVPTLLADGRQLRREVCYLRVPSSPTVAELIAEKVRAELRKVRLGADADTTVAPLVGGVVDAVAAPADLQQESAIIVRAWRAFASGQLRVLVDGAAAQRLEQQLELRRSSAIVFYPRALAAAC